jgi:hypothetical protein
VQQYRIFDKLRQRFGSTKPTQKSSSIVDLLDHDIVVARGLEIKCLNGQPIVSCLWIAEDCSLQLTQRDRKWFLACSDTSTGQRLIPLVLVKHHFELKPKDCCSFRIQTPALA